MSWRKWHNCPKCHKGHLQYNGYISGQAITIHYKCTFCGSEPTMEIKPEEVEYNAFKKRQ